MREIIKMLSGQLSELEHEFRVELPKEIAAAVAMGDLRENAEYHAALERQSFVKARISQLRERLGVLGTMSLDQVPRDRSGLGSTLQLLDLDSDEEIEYTLVIPEVADLAKGMISMASPIGRSLMGKTAGAEIVVKIPSGERNFEILKLVTLHEKPKQGKNADGSDAKHEASDS
jgi:transcription elongation factor GreA